MYTLVGQQFLFKFLYAAHYIFIFQRKHLFAKPGTKNRLTFCPYIFYLQFIQLVQHHMFLKFFVYLVLLSLLIFAKQTIRLHDEYLVHILAWLLLLTLYLHCFYLWVRIIHNIVQLVLHLFRQFLDLLTL